MSLPRDSLQPVGTGAANEDARRVGSTWGWLTAHQGWTERQIWNLASTPNSYSRTQVGANKGEPLLPRLRKVGVQGSWKCRVGLKAVEARVMQRKHTMSDCSPETATTPHSKDSRLGSCVYLQSVPPCQEWAGRRHGPVTFRMRILVAWAAAEGTPRAEKRTKGKSD